MSSLSFDLLERSLARTQARVQTNKEEEEDEGGGAEEEEEEVV